MIEGVKTKELKCIPDERGFLMEMLRCDDKIFEGFGQVYITGCKRGVAKAWHYHREQTDHFVCVWGKSLVVLYDMRKESATFGTVEEYILEAPQPCSSQLSTLTPQPSTLNSQLLLKIPPMIVHGFAAADCDEARIINIPTLSYRYENPDELRFPWDAKDIPYRWPSYIKTGG